MATVHVVLSEVDPACSVSGVPMPVAKSIARGRETVTTSASSARATLRGPSPPNGIFWDVTAKDADVWVNFGDSTTTAGSGSGWLVPAGQNRQWAVSNAGEYIALVDA